MSPSVPTAETPWETIDARTVAVMLSEVSVRWWLSGGVALDHWLGISVRERPNTDVSVVAADLEQLVSDLPEGFSAWAASDEPVVPFDDAPRDADLQPVWILDDAKGAWVLQVNVEDGAPRAWVYKRDPRLQLPWNRAVIEVEGIPTGAPEVQLVWKALRPRPEDEVDKDAAVAELSDEARAWWEKSILSVHPHSTWSIHVRSPFAPAKASWNKPRR